MAAPTINCRLQVGQTSTLPASNQAHGVQTARLAYYGAMEIYHANRSRAHEDPEFPAKDSVTASNTPKGKVGCVERELPLQCNGISQRGFRWSTRLLPCTTSP